MVWPLLLERLNDSAEDLNRRRLVHYHYLKNTEKYNELHYVAFDGLHGHAPLLPPLPCQ